MFNYNSSPFSGILRPDDAEIALSYGIKGIVVSNHGARQIDGVPATIDVLEAIRKQVRGRCELYLDGSIERTLISQKI